MLKKGLRCCLLIMMAFFFTGCGDKTSQNSEGMVNTDNMTFEGEEIILHDLKGKMELGRIQEDSLYFFSSENGQNRLYKTSMDGAYVEEIPCGFTENETVNCFYIDHDYIFCVNKKKDGRSELVRINQQSQRIEKIDLNESLSLEKELLNDITVDGSGNIILASSEKFYVLNEELQLEEEIGIEKNHSIITFCKTKSGKIICGIRDSGSEKEDLCILDTKTKEWRKNIGKRKNSIIDEKCLIEGGEYEAYYKDGGGIYGYDVEKEDWTVIMDARCSLLSVEDIGRVFGEHHGDFFQIEENTMLNRYSRMKPEESSDKKIITYAGYNVTNKLRTVAKEFNKTHNDCQIKIVLYDDEDHTRLAADIISGKVPDVFMVSTLGLSTQQLVNKGILENLTPYYEKDAEIKMEDIVPSVLEGMQIDNRLYSVSPSFSISSAACRKSDANEKDGWTIEEMSKVLNQKGEDALVFDELDKREILCTILMNNIDSFVNWETGECNFDCQEFKDMLQLCNEGICTDQLSEQEMNQLWDDVEKKEMDGKVLMTILPSINVDDIQLARQNFGTDIALIGLPEKDRNGSFFDFGEEYGVYSGSQVKDEAWEFIKMVMSEDFQIDARHLNDGYLPTRKDALDWKLETKLATKAYEDQFGNWIEPIEENIWYTSSGAERKTGPASQEDVDLLMDLIAKTRKRLVLDDTEVEIILEETEAYFNGEKDMDKVIKNIQKRMTTYVNEQR